MAKRKGKKPARDAVGRRCVQDASARQVGMWAGQGLNPECEGNGAENTTGPAPALAAASWRHKKLFGVQGRFRKAMIACFRHKQTKVVPQRSEIWVEGDVGSVVCSFTTLLLLLLLLPLLLLLQRSS